MKRWTTCAGALVAVLIFVITPAHAAIQLNPTGAGTASVVYHGISTFSNPGIPWQKDLMHTLIEKDFSGPGPIVFDPVTYAAGDLDWTNGFRWSERVNNNSGVGWSGYHLQLDDTSGVFFSDLPLFSPSIVEINGGGALSGAGNTLVYQSPITLSGDQKEAWVSFGSAVEDGGFFDIHVPIEGLSGTCSFVLTQTPTAIPEPASLVVWSLLGMGWAGVCVWRRRRG